MVQFLENKSGNRQSLFSVNEMGESFYYQHFWRWLVGFIVLGYPYITFYSWGKSIWGKTGGWICAITGFVIAIGGLFGRKWWIIVLIYLGTLVPFVMMVMDYFGE